MRASIVVAAVAIGLVGCQNSNIVNPLGGGSPAAVNIAVGDSLGTATPSFRPGVDTVAAGDTIAWVVDAGAGDAPFTVTWDQGPTGATLPKNSGDLQAGQTYTASFSVAGWYMYHCTHHTNMTGSLYVLVPRGG